MSGAALFRFALLLVKKGTLLGSVVDYDRQRKDSLKDVPREIFDPESFTQKSLYKTFRSWLLTIPSIRTLVGNAAFLRDPDKSYRQYYVSHDRHLVYIRIFKCGSTSILKSLLPLVHTPFRDYAISSPQIDSMAHYLVSKSLPEGIDNFTVFAITRNPLERLVSAYLDLFSDPSNYNDFLFGIFRKSRTFKGVLKIIAVIPDKFRGSHLVSQSRILSQVGSSRLQVFRLKSDNDSIELNTFLKNHSMELYVENKSAVAYNYRDYYDRETLQLAYQIYEKDFKTLGYYSEFHELKGIIDSESHGINPGDHSSVAEGD